MELENEIAKQAYISLLVDAQKKKLVILKELMRLTEQQESLISTENFSEEEFLAVVSLKEDQMNLLLKVDEGFEQLYERTKEELNSEKEKYAVEISTLKELIVEITDSSVKIQALEIRNKAKLEKYFSKRRKEIGSSRMNGKSVTNYYKTMNNQHEVQSFFYDKKK